MPNLDLKRKFAVTLAKCQLEEAFSDYMVFAFNRTDDPIELCEFGNVSSQEVLQKFYELFLAKVNSGEPFSENQ